MPPFRNQAPTWFIGLAVALCCAGAVWATPAKQRFSVLYDPGPAHHCYKVQEENPDDAQGWLLNPLKETSGCAPFYIPQRADPNCRDFGAIMPPDTPTCPTWKFVTYGWYYQKTPSAPSEFRVASGPGYDVRLKDGKQGATTTTLLNNARGKPDACLLREVTFAYEYPSSSFKRKDNWDVYTLDDGDRFNVLYTATVEGLAASDCDSERRTFLTTDLIYSYTDALGRYRTNVLSIIHYDATGLSLPSGIFWNACSDTGASPGCRLAVRGQQIVPGAKTRVSLEFKSLLRQYGSYLGHPGTVPARALVNAVQIVSSNRGSNATITLHDVQADLVTLLP